MDLVCLDVGEQLANNRMIEGELLVVAQMVCSCHHVVSCWEFASGSEGQ